MINASELFSSKIVESTRQFSARLMYGTEEISGAIRSVQITSGACGEGNFTVGAVFSSYIEVVIDECEDILEDKELLLQIGLFVDNETVEYVDIGPYTVTSPKSSAYSTTFTAVGRITSKLNKLFDAPAVLTLRNIANAITAATGVTIIFNGEVSNAVLAKDIKGMTCKEALSIIAGTFGGFATEDNSGNIVVSKYNTSSKIPVDGERMTALPEFNNLDYELYGIKVIVSAEGKDETGNAIGETAFTEGAPRLTMTNEFMTADLFESFARNTVGYTYRPGTVPLALGDPRIQPWDCLEVTDVKGNVYIVPCLNIVHTFDGGLTTTVTAPGESESESGSSVAGPITQQLERLNSLLITAQEAIIKRIRVDDLKAEVAKLGYASVESLDAVNVNLTNLAAKAITTDNLTAEVGKLGYLQAVALESEVAKLGYAKVKDLEATNAAIGSLQAEDARIEGLFTNYATIESLKAINGNVTNLQAKVATIEEAYVDTAKVDELIVAKGYITTAQTDTLLSNYVKTSTLTADYIKATDIASTYATIANLDAVNASIQGLDAIYATIDLANVKAGSITQAMIGEGVVGTAQIADGSITNAKIVELNASKITAGTLSVERLEIRGSTNSLVYELNNITGALQAQNVDTLNGEVLTPRTITADKIVAETITANEIAANAVTANKILAGAITSDKIVSGAITTDKLAANAVTAAKINVNDLFAQNITATGSITGAKLYGTHIEAITGIIGGFALANNILSAEVSNAYISPGYTEALRILEYSNHRIEFTDKEIAASDLNGDGLVNVKDAMFALQASLGTVKYSDLAGAKTSTVKVKIDPTNVNKVLHLIGTNAWGRDIESYLGIDGLKVLKVTAEDIRLDGSMLIGSGDMGLNEKGLCVNMGSSLEPTVLFGINGSHCISGSTDYSMNMFGSGTRPTYNGNTIALFSDITGSNIDLSDYALKDHTHDYLPLSGGSITGVIDASNTKNILDFGVVGWIRGKTPSGGRFDIFGYSDPTKLQVGGSYPALELKGKNSRPTYNGSDMALSSDLAGYALTSHSHDSVYATKTELNKKADDFSIEIYNGTAGNPKPVRFASFNYSTCNSEEGIAAKISLVSGHGNGSSYAFLQDAIIRVTHTGGVEVDNFKHYGANAGTYDGAARQYGDIFWLHDTTNKIVDFYCLMGQYARVYQTPWKRLTYSSKGSVTQYTNCTVYSSGTKAWANNSEYALLGDLAGYALSDHTHSEYALANHTHSEYLPLSGGLMTGSIKFQSSSLPGKALEYVCGIDAFAAGGEMGWQSKADFLAGYATTAQLSNYALSNHIHSEYALASDLSSYALASHDHDSIYAKKADLSGYAPTGHTHEYLPLVGGSLSGDLEFSNASSWIKAYLLAFKNADTNANPTYPYTGFYQWGDEWQVNARDANNVFVKNIMAINLVSGVANFGARPTVNGGSIALTADLSSYSLTSHNHDGVYAPLSHEHTYLTLVGGTVTNYLNVGDYISLLSSGSVSAESFALRKYGSTNSSTYVARRGENEEMIFGWSNDVMQLLGSEDRPTYNGNDLALYSDLSDYLSLSGGTVDGSLTVTQAAYLNKNVYVGGTLSVNDGVASIDGNGYVTGTWLKSTADTALSSAASEICVKQNGWIYTRTPAQILSDIGAAPVSHDHDGAYAKIADLSSYSLTNHNHDSVYAPLNHNHDYLPLSGGNLSGHVYLTGANATSSTGNTSQLVFGTSSNNHVALSSNNNALVINPTTSSTTNQIVLYLDQRSVFPSGISANVTGNLTGTASRATADGNGNNIVSTYATKAELAAAGGGGTTVLDRIAFQDTRSLNQTPLETPQGLSVHLKQNDIDGMSDGGAYHPVLVLRPWHDISGGPYGQITTTQNGNLYWRVSTAGNGSSWDGWQRAVKATELSNYSLTSHDHDSKYLPLSGGTLTGTLVAPVYKCDTSTAAIKPSNSNEINFGSNASYIYIGYENRVGSAGAVADYYFGTHSGAANAKKGRIWCGTLYEDGTALSDKYAKITDLAGYSLTSHNHEGVYAKIATANVYNGEQKFQNSTYCPTVTDTASGIGCAFKASRGMTNEMLVDKLVMTASTGKMPFYTYSGAANGQMTGLTEVAHITSTGCIITGSAEATAFSGIQSVRKCYADNDHANTAGFIINADGASKFIHRWGDTSVMEDAYFSFDSAGFKMYASGTKGTQPSTTPTFEALQNADRPTFKGAELALRSDTSDHTHSISSVSGLSARLSNYDGALADLDSRFTSHKHDCTELWSGNWSAGELGVTGSSKYRLYLITTVGRSDGSTQGTIILAIRNGNYIRGIGGYENGTPTDYTYHFAATVNGDTWTFVGAGYMYHSASGNHSARTLLAVSKIEGVM